MNNTIQQTKYPNTREGFYQAMIEQVGCHPQEFVGVSDAEIDKWLNHFKGKVHPDYRDFLKLCGKFCSGISYPGAGEYVFQIDFDVLLHTSKDWSKHKEGGPFLIIFQYLGDYQAYYKLDGSPQIYIWEFGKIKAVCENIWDFFMPGIRHENPEPLDPATFTPDFGEEDYEPGEEADYDDEKDYRPYVFLGIDPTKPWVYNGKKWVKESFS